MLKTEQELMEELVESIFSGNVDDDTEEKDESTEEESEEKDESTEESSEESSEDSDDKDEKSEDSDDESGEESDEDGDDDESDSDGDSDSKGGDGPAKGGPFTSKIRSLQKQYNDLLVDAFEKYAPECIEDALDETQSAFGENIEDILQNALDKLKGKIMGDLGVEGSSDLEGMEGMMPPSAMGSFDPTAGADKPMEIQIDKIG